MIISGRTRPTHCANFCNISTYPCPSKPRIIKVTISKAGTWISCLLQPIQFTPMKLCCDSGIICADICNISTYSCPSKPRISKSLPQKLVLEHSVCWNLFNSLLWNYVVIVESSLLTFEIIPTYPCPSWNQRFQSHYLKVGTWTFCLVKPIHFTVMKLCCDSGIICADNCNIPTYPCSSEHGLSKSLPQKWVLEHSVWWNLFISLLW